MCRPSRLWLPVQRCLCPAPQRWRGSVHLSPFLQALQLYWPGPCGHNGTLEVRFKGIFQDLLLSPSPINATLFPIIFFPRIGSSREGSQLLGSIRCLPLGWLLTRADSSCPRLHLIGFDEGARVRPQHGAHQGNQWAPSDRPTGYIYGCGRLIRSYFPGLERQACGTAAGQQRTPVPGSNRWRLVTDSDTAIGLERPIYLMASPEAGDSHYFSAWTLVDDSAGAKTIHFITAALTGEPWAILPRSLSLSIKVNLMKFRVESCGVGYSKWMCAEI